MAYTHKTREEWLMAGIARARPVFAQAEHLLPEKIRASCSWPGGGNARKRIGEAWSAKGSADGTVEIMVSPSLDDSVEVFAGLIHELIHAWQAGANLPLDHKIHFKVALPFFGLTGKPTATVADPEAFPAKWGDALRALGPYPHARLVKLDLKKQGTRMLKVVCPACGYALRTTAKWIEVGLPTCCCGVEMETGP